MPTYGEKWRANSSACEYGHVSRSHSTPFLRLDSTGEISSVDHSSQGDSIQFGSTPKREMNGNMVNMKNWVTNRVVGCNGLSASTLTGNKTNMNTTDFNANLFDSITQSMNGSVVNTMNSRYPNPKIMQPMCGISGWNYSGQGFGRVNTGAFGVFPCHQFSNSFTAPHCAYGQQGKVDMFSNPSFLTSARFWSKTQMMEDQQWHQRHRKYDRSYRGHSPKHHKHEHVRQEKKSIPSKDVPSKGTGKRRHEEEGVSHVSSVSEVTSPGDEKIEGEPKLQSSKSKDTDATPEVDISVKRPTRFSPGQCPSPTRAANSVVPDICNSTNASNSGKNGAQKLNVPEDKSSVKTESRKTNGVCGITQDLNQMLKVNITNSSDCRSEDTDVSNEKSSSCSMDPSKQESNFKVLFIRKNWKKGRPSSSKQRRRKLQKAKSATVSCSRPDKTTDADVETVNMVVTECKSEDENHTVSSSEDRKSGRCSATVSFILSQSPSSPNVPNGSSASSSFVFSFSDDEVDGENDDDWDTDFDACTDFNIEADFAQCDLFNFLPNNNSESSSPINWQVHISPLQNGPDMQDKTIEDINSSWNIQISVKEDTCKKKKPTKKVHFPEDKDLSVVHPMVAWSYAYRAARKGHWENFVRDRDRFKRRITEIENVIVPVLDSNHRHAVYVKRFKEIEDNTIY